MSPWSFSDCEAEADGWIGSPLPCPSRICLVLSFAFLSAFGRIGASASQDCKKDFFEIIMRSK